MTKKVEISPIACLNDIADEHQSSAKKRSTAYPTIPSMTIRSSWLMVLNHRLVLSTRYRRRNYRRFVNTSERSLRQARSENRDRQQARLSSSYRNQMAVCDCASTIEV
jgi:hypothetical protein